MKTTDQFSFLVLLKKDRETQFLLKLALCLTLVTLIGLMMLRTLGPKYEYIKADNEFPGASVYRYDKFSGSFERCFINKHRSEDFYKKFDKYGNSETLMCIKSYVFTQEDATNEQQKEIDKLKTETDKKFNEYLSGVKK